MAQELRDRFGPLPEPVQTLLYVVRVRALAREAGVQSIQTEDGQIVVRMVQGAGACRRSSCDAELPEGDLGRPDVAAAESDPAAGRLARRAAGRDGGTGGGGDRRRRGVTAGAGRAASSDWLQRSPRATGRPCSSPSTRRARASPRRRRGE